MRFANSCRRFRLIILAAACLVALAWPASALAGDEQDCRGGSDNSDTIIVDKPTIIQACTAVLNRDPNADWAYSWRAWALAKSGSLDQAIADYNRAIAIQPDKTLNTLYHFSRGELYLQKKDYSAAVRDFLPIAEDGDAPAQYDLASSYWALAEYQEAVKWLQPAAEKGYAKAQYLLSKAYEFGRGVQNDAGMAAYWLKQAAAQNLQEAVDDVEHLDTQCVLLDAYPEQNWSEKIPYCRLWLALDPQKAGPWLFLGRIHCSMLAYPNSPAEYEEGLADFLKSIELTKPEDDKNAVVGRSQRLVECAYFTNQENALAVRQARSLVYSPSLQTDSDDDKFVAHYLYFYTSLRAELYLESVSAFEYLEQSDKASLSGGDYNVDGVALAVIGDYTRAASAFENAVTKLSGDDNSALEWLTVARFAEQGWPAIQRMWPSWNAGNIEWPFTAGRRQLLLYYGLKDLGDRAIRAGMPYVALMHYSKAFQSLADAADYNIGASTEPNVFYLWATDNSAASSQDPLSDAANDLVISLANLYRALPVKPAPTQEALDYTRQGQRLINEAAATNNSDGQYNAVHDALISLGRAVSSAPWWPDAHYNFAMALAAWGAPRMAIREMSIFTNMSPDNSRAQLAKNKIALWTERAKLQNDVNYLFP